VQVILLTGGLSRNAVYVQELADVCGVPVLLPREPDAVLLGGAIVAAAAAAAAAETPHETLENVGSRMSAVGERVEPRVHTKAFHDAKFAVFKTLLSSQRECIRLMSTA